MSSDPCRDELVRTLQGGLYHVIIGTWDAEGSSGTIQTAMSFARISAGLTKRDVAGNYYFSVYDSSF
jgi:hypothetical protein